MRLLLLGTSGYHPTDLRQTACMMLPETGVILDAGTGMYRVSRHLQTATLDIFLTHAHLDHVVGLTYLLDVLYEREMERVCVHGEAEKLAAVEEHVFSEHVFPVRPPFQQRPLEPRVPVPGGGFVSHFALDHPGGSLGYRLEWPGRSLAYITDTTADLDAAYVEHLRGVDVLLHECYFPDGWEEKAKLTGHSCVTTVAEVARKAEVGRLILIHINPHTGEDDPVGLDVARSIFPSTDLGRDQMEIEF
ncbi:MAG: MBL fold metallo-hydrolase [Planctomycetes bacterium]|nr:MBL fold metallo-hydrolase [Planctomycetota bacterium]MBL7040233.1 MBL fold metallo-hydrolase [Pirellulaceae bacterium]